MGTKTWENMETWGQKHGETWETWGQKHGNMGTETWETWGQTGSFLLFLFPRIKNYGKHPVCPQVSSVSSHYPNSGILWQELLFWRKRANGHADHYLYY